MRCQRSGTVLLAVVCAAALSAIGADAASRAPARMLVYAQEWSLWPSRTSLPAGKVIVQLWNRGQDAHDLRIRRLRGGHLTGAAQGVAVTESGGISAAAWHLAPGRYELYCSMPGHLARGMHTTVIVR
jgi:plastocyanin